MRLSVRFCFGQEKTVCMYGCTCACVCGCDGDVVCVGHDLNWCTGWWYVCSVYVEQCWSPKVMASFSAFGGELPVHSLEGSVLCPVSPRTVSMCFFGVRL